MVTAIPPEQRMILVECLRRQREHRKTPPPPKWQIWDRRGRDEQTRHGPRYGSGEWFGEMPEYQRMRFRRAVDALEAAGLIRTWRACGKRLTNIKLTAAGKTAAEEILAGQNASED